MSFIPVTFGEVTLEWAIAGSSRPSFTVFGIENSVAADPIDIADAIDGILPGTILQMMCAETVLTSIRVETGEGEQYEKAVTHAGAVGDDQAPPNVTYLVRKATDLVGRKRQGRMYIPAVPEGLITAGGFLSGPGRAAAQDAVTDFNDQMSFAGFDIYVLHSDAGATAPTYVVRLEVESKVATQRRRLRS